MQAVESSLREALESLNLDEAVSGIYVAEVDRESVDPFVNSAKFAILGFHEYWCDPSRLLLSYLWKAAKKYMKDTVVGAMWFNEEGRKFAKYHGVDAIPATLLFHNGYKSEKIIGIMSEEDFFNILDKKII